MSVLSIVVEEKLDSVRSFASVVEVVRFDVGR
jgi:hypothetical protein